LDIKLPTGVPDTEFSQRFTQGMADRMAMSYFKYGPLAKAYPDRVDAIATLKLKLAAYEASGNTEILQDVANYAMIEFLRPRHLKAHYQATDSSEKHARRVWHGEVDPSARGNDPGSWKD
jgi:hypothetical protein